MATSFRLACVYAYAFRFTLIQYSHPDKRTEERFRQLARRKRQSGWMDSSADRSGSRRQCEIMSGNENKILRMRLHVNLSLSLSFSLSSCRSCKWSEYYCNLHANGPSTHNRIMSCNTFLSFYPSSTVQLTDHPPHNSIVLSCWNLNTKASEWVGGVCFWQTTALRITSSLKSSNFLSAALTHIILMSSNSLSLPVCVDIIISYEW